MDISTRDAVSPIVMMRRITPANRPLQHLEAGQLGASTPQHVASRPSVPDLCIASANLLSLIDPLPLDHCPDSARTQGANERVVLCLMNELVADHERVL